MSKMLAKRDTLCICIPQPYASYIVHGFYRTLPLRNNFAIKDYKGLLWIASSERHSRSEPKAALNDISIFYKSCNIVPPPGFVKMPKHMPLSCLLGCVYLSDSDNIFPVEDIPCKHLSAYEKSLRFSLKFTLPKRLIMPLQINLGNKKSNVIILSKKMLQSAMLQEPKQSSFNLPSIESTIQQNIRNTSIKYIKDNKCSSSKEPVQNIKHITNKLYHKDLIHLANSNSHNSAGIRNIYIGTKLT